MLLVKCLDVAEQWAPEDTSTPIKPDSRKEVAASRTLDETDRSLAAAGTFSTSSYCMLFNLCNAATTHAV